MRARPTPDTATQIAAAARRLFERHGRDAVSMRRVAQAVGITPMAIYRHYDGTDALLNAIAQQGFEEMAARLSATRGRTAPLPYVEKVVDAYVAYALAAPAMFDLMFLERRAGARQFPEDFRRGHSPTGNLLAAAVAEAMQARRLRADDVWEVTLAIWAQVHGLVVLHRAGRMSLKAPAFRALCRRSVRRLLHGLAR